MNKYIILPALGLSLMSSFANADVTVYGKAHVAVENNGTVTEINSNASRLGVKGKSKLSDSLSVIYKYEMGIDLDGSKGNPGFISQRNQYVGLKGSFGKVIAGINDTPVKTLEPKDLFNDGFADIGKVLDKYVNVQEREKGFLGYYAPKFGNTQLSLGFMPGKGGASLTDATSIALLHGDKKLKKTSFFAGIGMDNGVDGANTSVMRLSGGIKLNNVKLGGIIENAVNAADLSQSRFMINASMKLAGGKVKAQMVSADKVGATKSSLQTSLGYEMSLGKKTNLYFHVSKKDLKGTETSYSSIGMVHKF